MNGVVALSVYVRRSPACLSLLEECPPEQSRNGEAEAHLEQCTGEPSVLYPP